MQTISNWRHLFDSDCGADFQAEPRPGIRNFYPMQFCTQYLEPVSAVLARIVDRASQLDRVADIELAHGHGPIAERLATLAAELRAVAQ